MNNEFWSDLGWKWPKNMPRGHTLHTPESIPDMPVIQVLWSHIKKMTKKHQKSHFLPLSPKGWWGIVVVVRPGGREGGCQICGTHISVTTSRIFSIRSYVELSRPVVVHCHGHLPLYPIWACPWAKSFSNSPHIWSRLCGTHISETAGWIYPHLKFYGHV